MRILVAEDEPDMQKIIKIYLLKEGYEVSVASDGEEALNLLCTEKFDLVVLDWMMPRMDGIEICTAIKTYNIPTKIIMLTAKSEVQNEIIGLSCGADDYIKKPFEPNILLLRIKKLFHLENVLICGDVSLNQETWIAKKGANELTLTKKEFALLKVFLLNCGIVLSREKLLNNVWGMDYEGDERTVDTHIRRLRTKIGEDYISTHIGIGYVMVEPDE